MAEAASHHHHRYIDDASMYTTIKTNTLFDEVSEVNLGKTWTGRDRPVMLKQRGYTIAAGSSLF